MEEPNQDILQDEEIEVTADSSTFDIECSLQQLNIDFNLICGVYLYATSSGDINISKIGTDKHIQILETAYQNHLEEMKNGS